MYPQDYHSPSLTLGGFDTMDEDGFVRVVGRGLWTVPMLDAHFVNLSAALRRIRADRGHAAVLADLRMAPPQTPAVNAQLSTWTAKLYTARDRAIVVASSLLKAQMRRTQVAATRELFVSLHAAELWLCAPAAREPSASRVA